ncbi:MAG: recombination mediator RecR [Patescibacteria group bacterium]
MKDSRPAIISALIEQLSELPGVGNKTAERYVYYLINQSADKLEKLGQDIAAINQTITKCSVCHRIADKDICLICADNNRDKETLCVLAESQDIAAIENTDSFNGRYHILGGLLNPLEGITTDKLAIKSLLERINKEGIKEIIIAFNPDMEGESTALYLIKQLKNISVRVTRLARGLPMGADLAYADEITLTNALVGRQVVK